mgnify:FL=1
MDEKVLPLLVSTYEAFCNCMEFNVKAIYIYKEVYMKHAEEICQFLEERGYEFPGFPTRQGVLFVKGIDIETVILSPCLL